MVWWKFSLYKSVYWVQLTFRILKFSPVQLDFIYTEPNQKNSHLKAIDILR